MMFVGVFVFTVVVVASVLLVWWLVTQSQKQDPLKKSKDDNQPLEILKKRYARGEITKEQFEDMKKDLGS